MRTKTQNGKSGNLSLLGYTKKALYIALHPGSISESYGVGDAIAFYYKAAIIPAIISEILMLLLIEAFGFQFIPSIALFGGGVMPPIISEIVFVFGSIGIGLTYVLLLIPIGIIISGGLYQFSGKTLFKIWKKDISKTTTAVTYASFPAMLFGWATLIPIAGIVIGIVIAMWTLIVSVISISRQHGVSKGNALGGIIISDLVLVLIVWAVVFAFSLVLVAEVHSSFAGLKALTVENMPASSYL